MLKKTTGASIYDESPCITYFITVYSFPNSDRLVLKFIVIISLGHLRVSVYSD